MSENSIPAADLRKAIDEAIRLKGLASEYQGNHGKHVAMIVERHGIEKTAFTFCRRLKEMEEGKRQAILRSLIDYCHKLGFFDQIDAFDDLLDTLQNILDGANETRENRSRQNDATLDSIAGAA